MTVTLKIEISEENTTFLTFDDGGTAKVEKITDDEMVVIGDDPVPTPLKQYEVPVDESYSWKVVLPREEKDVWGVFINSIQSYRR